jgi:Flp pilus assembly protein TadG
MRRAFKLLIHPGRRRERGAIIVLVAFLAVVFVGLAALTVDLSHLFVVRNELQNAADAGALRGARVLYNDAGTLVNEGANLEAYNATIANTALAQTGNVPVDVNWTSGNSGDVQRGHWRFSTRTFTPNDSTAPVVLWDRTAEELDADTDFINAVKVTTRRSTTPAASFFARVFGYQSFTLVTDAVAYIGFAGSLEPLAADQPIAICKQSVTDPDTGAYTCNTGRMLNSSGGTTSNTAAWTSFMQPETCTGGASNSDINPLICAGGNPASIIFGVEMETTNGVLANTYNDLRACWLNAPVAKDWRGYPREPWHWTLPVIDCPDNNPGPCSTAIGVVTVDLLWIKESGTDPHWTDIPVQMEGWECSHWVSAGRPQPANSNSLLDDSLRQQCWQEFAATFNLKTADGTSVGDLTSSDLQKTMFFKPDCTPHEPTGGTGGENFGVLAEIPVLVE